MAAELAATDPRIVLVDNPIGRTPLRAQRRHRGHPHPYVVRVDGHGSCRPATCGGVANPGRATGAANVGGMMRVEGVTTSAGGGVAMPRRSGSAARSSTPAARRGRRTVYLGAFRRDVLVELGGYDEYFCRAQDWEINHRIRQAGGHVWFTPDLA